MTPQIILRSDFAQAIAEVAPTLVTDLETGEILFASRQLEDLFAVRVRGELVGQPVEMLLPEPHRERHVEHRRRYALAPIPRAMGGSLELVGLRRDGTIFPVEVSLFPIVIAGRRCVVGVLIDVSGRAGRAHAGP